MGFDVLYNPAVLRINAENHNFLITANPGSNLFVAVTKHPASRRQMAPSTSPL
jgi:hypothetical protein